MGKAGRSFVEEHLSTQAMINAYDRLLTRSPAKR
jgi:hypothetical protein